MKRVADIVADFIAAKGVEDFFLLPGGGAMYLVDALGNHEKLNPIAMHHEQSALIAAESYGRVRENFGVALVTTGPGATNGVTPLAGAWIESLPLMIISGQVKRSDLIGERKIRQGGVQEVDIISMVKKYTKYAVTIKEPESIVYHLTCAYEAMMSGRQGPVWLDIPLDVQSTLVEVENITDITKPKQPSAQDLDKKIATLLKLIVQAEKPLILAGHGVRLAKGKDALLKVAEALRIPVVTTWNAMDLISHEHPLFAGKVGVVAPRYGNFAIQNSDLLIAIGSRLDNVITAYNPKKFAKNAKKVIIDIDEAEICNSQITFDLKITADAKSFLNKLFEQAPKAVADTQNWIKRCQRWKQKYAITNEPGFDKSTNKLSHYAFASQLSQLLQGGELIATGSSGLGIEAFYVAFDVKKEQRIFLTSGLGAMGYGLPSAIGTAIANHKQKIIAIESDGSLQLNIQELATLKGQNLPIMLFILDNKGYASIRNTQQNYFNGRYVATDKNSGLYLPDLEQVIRGYGIEVHQIHNYSDLAQAVKAFENLTEPCVYLVNLEENETLYPKSIALPGEDGNLISMPLEDMSPLLPIEVLEEEMDFPLEEASYRVRTQTKKG